MILGIYSRCTPLLLGTQVSDIGPSWSSCIGGGGVYSKSRESRNNLTYTGEIECSKGNRYEDQFVLSVSSELSSTLTKMDKNCWKDK